MIRRGMILAAGFGTRLRPLTRRVPKPMVPLCNRPLIGWALDSLLAAGIDRIIVNLHHAPETIEAWLPAQAGERAHIDFVHEEEILGTGGGIRNARHLLEGDGQFALVNGDTVQRPPFLRLASAREQTDAIAALLLRLPPLNDRFTPVYFDEPLVTGFGEGTGRAVMFAGAHVISDRIFSRLPERPFSGIVEHAYMPALRGEGRIVGVIDSGFWFDIGTPARLHQASMEMLELMRSGTVSPPEGSRMLGSSLSGSGQITGLGRSVAGRDVRVEEDVRVQESVLLDDVTIGPGSNVTRCIVGPGVALPPGSRCDNAFICVRVGDEEEGEAALDGNLIALPVYPDQPHWVS